MNGITAETTNYYYNGSVLMAMQAGNTVQRFSHDAQGKVVSVNYNGTEYYYLRNAQGDIVKLIDNGGGTKVEYTYDSWGKLISTAGSLATSLGANQPFRYRGYVYDTETSWYYLQSRYYDPTTCRFISSDVYLSTGQGVLGHNSYAYCLNNPVNLEDQSGAAAHFNSTVVVCDGGCDNKPRYPKSWDELNDGLAYYGITSNKTANWVSVAATDAWNWTSNAVQDAANWVGQAATDVWNQTKFEVQMFVWSVNELFPTQEAAENAFFTITGTTTGILSYGPVAEFLMIPEVAAIALGAISIGCGVWGVGRLFRLW